jgi:starch synthase
MKVLFVASEAVPHAKTGGLADVVGALPQHLNELGVETTVLIPKYKGITATPERKITLRMKNPHTFKISRRGSYLFVDYPDYFERTGLYGDEKGDYADNCERFTLFCLAALKVAQDGNFDIVHCHDWQSGLLPLYLKHVQAEPKSVFTIHNLGYQGKFPASKFPLLGLGKSYLTPDGLEFYGDISFLKAGIVFSDKVTTVSKTYAEEIQAAELGFGLDGVLRARARDLHGIINGIDYERWNAESDDLIYQKYTDFNGKQKNKSDLCRDNALDPRRPLIGMVSRIAGQKGFDILIRGIDEIIGMGYSMIILGFGDESYHKKLLEFSRVHYGKLSINIKFDERLAHRIYAGSDFFLMPSQYEPCGLGQLISLRYGTVPIVRKTGGLADTVFEFDDTTAEGNGFLFVEYTGEALLEAIRRARSVFAQSEVFERLSEKCMGYNYSWTESAKQYSQLYEVLCSP